MDSLIPTRPFVEGPLLATGLSLSYPIYSSSPYEWLAMGFFSGLGMSCLGNFAIAPARLVQHALVSTLSGMISRIANVRRASLFLAANVLFTGASTLLGLSLYAKISSLAGKILLTSLYSGFVRSAVSPAYDWNESLDHLELDDSDTGLNSPLYAGGHIAVLAATGNPILAAAAPALFFLASLFFKTETSVSKALISNRA